MPSAVRPSLWARVINSPYTPFWLLVGLTVAMTLLIIPAVFFPEQETVMDIGRGIIIVPNILLTAYGLSRIQSVPDWSLLRRGLLSVSQVGISLLFLTVVTLGFLDSITFDPHIRGFLTGAISLANLHQVVLFYLRPPGGRLATRFTVAQLAGGLLAAIILIAGLYGPENAVAGCAYAFIGFSVLSVVFAGLGADATARHDAARASDIVEQQEGMDSNIEATQVIIGEDSVPAIMLGRSESYIMATSDVPTDEIDLTDVGRDATRASTRASSPHQRPRQE